MKKHKNSQERPTTLKRKLMAATSMLLISAVLLAVTSYAWLVMSTAPEVTGITTNVAANGSLEIALLTTETRQDLSAIKTAIGQSLALNKTTANNTWGNLIDLNDKSYGLGEIALLPARLDVTESGGQYRVGSNILSVPTYGYDGRIIELTNDTLSAVYGESEFATILGQQDYGVRAIGTSSSVSVQGSALALAKANVVTYTNSAKTAATSALKNNIEDLFGIVIAYSASSSATFDDGDLDVIKAMIADLQSSVDYIDLTIRQGIIAVAASEVGDEDKFSTIRDMVNNAEDLNALLTQMQEAGVNTIPSAFNTWVTELAELQNSVNLATINADALNDGEYTWAELKDALDPIMNMDEVFINDKKFSNMSGSELTGLMTSAGEVKMTLASGSGVLGDIADFTDDFVVNITVIGKAFEITTMTLVNPPYLTALYDAVKDLEAADGSTEGETEVALSAMYGYALDMAFRCNAPLSDLLLQTTPEQRVYKDSDSASTMGGGSYMEFSTNASDYPLEKMLALMDAIRVGFMDDQGTLLNVAKLNVSNRVVTDEVVQAPLYLYDFSLSEDPEDYGAMVMGERRTTNNVITSLEQSVAKAITVVVWLDGDLVDNTMVASSSSDGLSLNGILNLQFASSADLMPADNSDLMYITADKTTLNEMVTENEETYNAGQGSKTTVSWDAYTAAYEFAVAINNNPNATEAQIFKAMTLLTEAKAGLQNADMAALRDKIADLREWMGQSNDIARYVMYSSEKGYYGVDPYTQEQKDQKVGTIYRVDYTKNLHDEGNGVMTGIYTDSSWSNLAAALYDAEVLSLIAPNASARELDDAITALDVAYQALERRVFYVPYEYEGSIYYFAISDETDTYGKWYDSDFKRIVSDLKVLELDARAELAEVAVIEQDSYIEYNSTNVAITPFIELLSDVYPDLTKDEIIAIHWGVTEHFTQAMTLSQKSYLTDLIARANALNALNQAEYAVDAALITAAETVLTGYETITLNTATKVVAEETIVALESAVLAAEKAKAEKEASDAAAAVDKNTADMTSEQRTLLTTAVTNAKTIEGYETSADLDQLRAATEAVEALLAKTAGVTIKNAEDALAALNEQLTANGLKEVTAYNTIQHNLPIGSEIYEVGYATDISATLLRPTQNTGSAEITAVVLTKNGMVFKAKKTVTVYAPADGVEIKHPNTAPAGGTIEETVVGEEKVYTWDGKIQKNASWKISAALIPCSDDPGQDAEGNPLLNLSVGEEIKSCTWASTSLDILKVSGDDTECTITAVGAGTATISVSVTTVQGNVYTASVTVTVTGE